MLLTSTLLLYLYLHCVKQNPHIYFESACNKSISALIPSSFFGRGSFHSSESAKFEKNLKILNYLNYPLN